MAEPLGWLGPPARALPLFSLPPSSLGRKPLFVQTQERVVKAGGRGWFMGEIAATTICQGLSLLPLIPLSPPSRSCL